MPQAVKFTFDRLLGPLGQKGAQYFQYKTIKQVKVVDPYTVDFITKSPDPVLVTKLAGYGAMIVPPAYIKKHGDTYFGTHPIGTGAFMVTKYVPNVRSRPGALRPLLARAGQDGQADLPLHPEDSTRLAELQTGRIDIMQNVAIGQAAEISGDPNLKLLPGGQPHGDRHLPQRRASARPITSWSARPSTTPSTRRPSSRTCWTATASRSRPGRAP